MIRPPPRSTLLPYPTLFRSSETNLFHRTACRVTAAQKIAPFASDGFDFDVLSRFRLEEARRCLQNIGIESARQPFVSGDQDRKSTRLNSSHDQISYAVFCLK